MKLLYPEFLWALTAVLIPIIIHLFNFRKYKKEYFSNIALLKDVKQETQNKSKLKHLLILLTRISAIVLLVIAFCQPYIPKYKNATAFAEKAISIYIDNSLSMDVKSDDGYLLDIAKETALNIVESYSITDEFLLLTNDFEGKHQRLVSQEEIKRYIEEVTISASRKTAQEVHQRASDILSSFKGSKEAFWLSDFQKNSYDFSKIINDTTLYVNLVPLIVSTQPNVYIDSIHFTSPVRQLNTEEQLNVTLKNQSENTIEGQLSLQINGTTKGLSNSEINSFSQKEVPLHYTVQDKGLSFGTVTLDEYPNPNFVLDDRFFFSYKIDSSIAVLYLSDQNHIIDSTNAIVAVFSGDDNYNLTVKNLSNIDYSTLQNYTLIIVENLQNLSSGLAVELKKFIQNGGSLTLIPAKNIDLNSYQSFLQSMTGVSISSLQQVQLKVGKINKGHPLYANVFETTPKNIDLPLVSAYYPTHFTTQSRTQFIQTLQNDAPFITVSKSGKGKLYWFSAPLSETTVTQHALFVPTLLRIAEMGYSEYPLYYTIGENDLVTIPLNNYVQGRLTIKQNNSNFEMIPELIKTNTKVELDLHQSIKQAGHYTLYYDSVPLLPISFNYDRKESDLTYLSPDSIQNELNTNSLDKNFEINNNSYIRHKGENIFNENNTGKKYWKYFLITAILFLLIETLIIRYYR